MRVLWELRNGPMSFRQLREGCDEVSPSVLNARLRELREARLVTRSDEGYVLTPTAWELIAAFEPLHHIAERWAKQTTEDSGKSLGATGHES